MGTEPKTVADFLIKNRQGINWWKPLLRQWVKTNRRYSEVLEECDASYLYTERTMVGFLAGAAWLAGWVAMEEFQSQKGHSNAAKRKGRADLYLASEKHECLVEAKLQWLSMSSSAFCENAVDVLERARKDARMTRGGTGRGHTKIDCSIGVAFVPVYLGGGKIVERELRQQIEGIADELMSNSLVHAMAWFFPQEYRDVRNGSDNFTPGVFLIASRVA